MRKWLGLSILLLVAGLVMTATQFDWGSLQRAVPIKQDWVNLSIYYGGEKSRFLADPEVQEILARYKIRLDAAKAGSIEQVTQLPITSKDCLWPSNQFAVDLARQSGKPVISDNTVFSSVVTFYAWRPVTDALIKLGIAQRDNNIVTVNTQKLVALVKDNKRWKEDLGLDIYGTVKIFSTDPRRSNSGNMWAGLLADTLNGGNVVNQSDLPRVMPDVQHYFQSMGYMESNSGDVFETFLKQGMGAHPMIVGYENQLVEFVLEHQEYRGVIQDKIDILYPTPTVFVNHPLVALTNNCKRLEAALQDSQLQQLAWQRHGFRTGLLGVTNNPEVLQMGGIPETINQIIPMPDGRVMQQMMDAL